MTARFWSSGGGDLTEVVYGPQPGESSAATGYDLVAGAGGIAWYLDVLDAVDAMKRLAGPARIIRCCDRCLIKVRHGRPTKRRAA